MRALATIRKVLNTIPIEGADVIELVQMQNIAWQCVVKKGEFTPDSLGVYFEIDSFLPIDDRYEFLRSRCLKKMAGIEGFRLKTMRLRGCLSQGLFLPISLFPELTNLEVGSDVTSILNIELYEEPLSAQLAGSARGVFPSFISKTDQIRIQNLLDYFDKYADTEFEATLKMDGSSMTVYFNDGDFGVCSRNLNLKNTDNNTFWQVTKELELEDILTNHLRKNIAIQGELVGEGIQKNPHKLKGHNLYVFDIYDIDKGTYMNINDRVTIINSINDILMQRAKFADQIPLKHVPRVDIVKLKDYDNFDKLHAFVAKCPGFNAKLDNFDSSLICEGLVFKSMELIDGNIISFKCINNNYL